MRETFPCINTPLSAGVRLIALGSLCARLWVRTAATSYSYLSYGGHRTNPRLSDQATSSSLFLI